jgi:glycosyltransferase involved in cell wall biosynthesis
VPLEIVDDYRDSAFARAQTGLLFNLPVPPAEREQLPPGISLCMIVKNEERFLAECLASVRDVVGEICVVDTGSTDRTIEIAREFGAIVVERPWRDDFSWARNESLNLATRRWTLVLDADEEVSPESLGLLRALRETPADLTAVYLQIRNLVDDESGMGSTMSHILPRIFPTSPRIRYKNVIHENVVLDGDTHLAAIVSPILVLHKGYTKAILDGRSKNDRNKPLLERAIREASGDAFSWFNFGVSAIVAGDLDAGIEALERMFAMDGPARAFYAMGYVMLATAYAEGRHDVEKGIALLDEGLEGSPGHPNILFTKGYFLSLLERYDEAREWYEKATKTGSDARLHFLVDDEIAIWKAPLNIAATYAKQGRDADALLWYERALANKPESTLLRGLAARAYERAGRVYDAERMFREASERDGDGGFIAYVNYLMRRRRFHEAFEQVERRREAIEDRAYAVLLLSAAVATRDEKLGDPEGYALRALELANGDGLALGFLDALYAARNDTRKRAELRARELTAPLVQSADFARRSHRLLEEQQFEAALSAARAGLAVAPDNDVLLYNAGLSAARLGRDADAIEHLNAISPKDAHATDGLALRAEIERRSGDLDAAVATLSRVSGLEHPNVEVLRGASLGLASALLEAGRIEDAGKLAALALA